MPRFTRLLAVAGAALLAAASASHAAVPVPVQSFSFYGDCLDCTLNSQPGQPMATLVLTIGYQPGSPIGNTNFVSFSYVGSNLVDPYTVVPFNPDRSLGQFAAYSIAGAMDGSPGPKSFLIEFDDGLRFESLSSGGWYTCAPGPSKGYYSGTCDYLNNDDFGERGSWNQPIPEPGTYGLMALGLGVLGIAARRRRSNAASA